MSKKIIGIFLIISLILAPLISSLSTNEKKLEVTKNSISDCISVYKAYAYVSYYPSGEEGLYGFEMFPFGNFTYLGPGGSSDFLTGACFVPPCYIYFSEYGTGIIYALDILTLEFYEIGGGGSGLNGLDYDDESGNLYAVDSYDLYHINITTGEQSYIGGWGSGYLMSTIAIYNGICYGLDIITDSIYLIDLDTADLTLVGPTGLSLNYVYDMGFDKENGILYLAAYSSLGQLFQVNINTGECTLLGNFPDGLEVSAFAFIYGNIPPYVPCDPYPKDGEPCIPLDLILSWKGGDYNSGDNVTYDVYFDDVLPPALKSTKQKENYWAIPYQLTLYKTYYWKIVAWDSGGLSTEGPIWTFTTADQCCPSVIIYGPTNGNVGVPYTYTFNSTDECNYDLITKVDWGDGSPIESIGPSPSGVEVNATHTWYKMGTYIIRAKAINIYGIEGDWSEHQVTIPRNKETYNSILLKLLEGYPIFQQFYSIFWRYVK